MANDWDVNTGTILRTSSRQSIATIGGCNSHYVSAPVSHGNAVLSSRVYRSHGRRVLPMSGWLVSPSPPGAVVLVAGGDHRQAAWFTTVKRLGSPHSGNCWDRGCLSVLPTRAPLVVNGNADGCWAQQAKCDITLNCENFGKLGFLIVNLTNFALGVRERFQQILKKILVSIVYMISVFSPA
jgi:hypothetical protein